MVSAPAFEPRRPALWAGLVFVLAALALCWPMLQGRWLLGDDQYIAGYAFRMFGAEMFRQTGSIPHWNPYIFGGLPFVAAMHGDIFYPTAWLRWFLPVDTAMNLGFALHIVLAGWLMYGFLRALRLSWTGALVGGVAYELTGIVASLVSPGHDGKLFVSALTPLLLMALVRGIRDGRMWGYGLAALATGLAMLSPQYQMAYYMLVAGGIWTLYLVFFDPDRPAGRRWWLPLGWSLGAVLLGIAIAAIQLLPFLAYVPFSPRAAGGASTGWQYATQFAMPVEEIFTTVLPQFNGVLSNYWGQNFFKSHTEYLGAVVVLLAAVGIFSRPRERRPWRTALGVIALLFLLVAFGAHTPFYRVWYEVMPMMKKVRAEGMAFFLPALVVAAFAGIGADRLGRREASLLPLWIAAGVLGLFALIGGAGGLLEVTTSLAQPQLVDRAIANGPALQSGAIRLLAFVLAGTLVLWAVGSGRMAGWIAAAALAITVGADLWSIDRMFFQYLPPASVTFADDSITSYLHKVPMPYRVLEFGGEAAIGPPGQEVPLKRFAVYGASILMAYNIPQVLGYHGQELRFYDDLLGGKNIWPNQLNSNVQDLLAAGYLVTTADQPIPGYHKVLGPVPTNSPQRAPGVLYQRDTMPAYVRMVPGAAKVPEDQIVPTILNARFPTNLLLLLPDTSSAQVQPLGQVLPPPAAVTARIEQWSPSGMRVDLTGSDTRPTWLLVSQSWAPDWSATVDGKDTPVYRGDMALITVPVPPGAHSVEFRYEPRVYGRARAISFAALLATMVLLAGGIRKRRQPGEVV